MIVAFEHESVEPVRGSREVEPTNYVSRAPANPRMQTISPSPPFGFDQEDDVVPMDILFATTPQPEPSMNRNQTKRRVQEVSGGGGSSRGTPTSPSNAPCHKSECSGSSNGQVSPRVSLHRTLLKCIIDYRAQPWAACSRRVDATGDHKQ